MYKACLILIFLICNLPVLSQIKISGSLVDAKTHEALSYVNIGIKDENIGTVSLENGTFSIEVAEKFLNDTLTFSLIGYHEYNLLINSIGQKELVLVELNEKNLALKEVLVTAERLVEKKYGIKRRNALIHFSDGMFLESNDIFEIGQLIKLKDKTAQITSANLYLFGSEKDSATFRVNFYKYQDGLPGSRIVEKSIVKRHPLNKGWLRLDLTEYNIVLKGEFIASLEILPESKNNKPISYEIKLGGLSKSFFRGNSLGQWNRPPHHYCFYVTALVDKNTSDEPFDVESLPAFTQKSAIVKDSFSIFVNLPLDYLQNNTQNYPVLYHLDGNAYFDQVNSSIDHLQKKKKLKIEPIVVGIGYDNAYVMDSLRVRDYTFPEALPLDSFPTSGGGERFYQFLKTELIPYIDQM